MMNELFELQSSLESEGIEQQEWHKNYKTLPKNKTLLVLLDDEGKVTDLEDGETQQMTVRKWETSNGHSFPAFNTPALLDVRTEETEKLKEIQEQKKKLQTGDLESWLYWEDLIANGKCLWENSSTQNKLIKCLNEIRTDLQTRLQEIPHKFQAFQQLLIRADKINLLDFQLQIQSILIQKIQKEPKRGIWFDTLFCVAGKPKNTGWILEVANRLAFDRPSSHNTTIDWINQQLLREFQHRVPNPGLLGQQEIDPFGGPKDGWKDKLPKVTLPFIGGVILRAMTKDVPCQKRYGRIESEGFPVGNQTSSRMKKALEWLSNSEFEGKTWSNISRVRGDSSLLFAYPSHFPQKEPDGSFADYIGSMKQDDADGTFFVTCAESVIKALKGIPDEADAEFRVFVLTKPDGFRTKVQFDQGYRVQRVIQSAKDWREGCKNIPEIILLRFQKDQPKKPVRKHPYVPSPGEVIWCCNTIWTESASQGDSSPHLAKNAAMRDGLLLLLDDGHRSQETTRFLLRQILSHALPLLLRIGHCMHEGIVCVTHKSYSKQILLFPSIFGLLLYKLQLSKGDYMKSAPYLIGRLLSLSDQIHLQYAKQVRNDIPAKLMGNSLMQTALEMPEKALATFWQRFSPYYAWAQKFEDSQLRKKKDERSLLEQIGDVTYQLGEQEIPARCNDTQKAQMMLGYLATNPSKQQEAFTQEVK